MNHQTGIGEPVSLEVSSCFPEHWREVVWGTTSILKTAVGSLNVPGESLHLRQNRFYWGSSREGCWNTEITVCSLEKEQLEILLKEALLWFVSLLWHNAIEISSPALQSCCAVTAFGVGSACLLHQPKASWPRSRNKTFYQKASVEFSEKWSLCSQ